jgi:phosphotriesterase-related protein
MTTSDYQRTIAARGAFIEFDMIGMDYFYADQQVQCPSDDEVARAILRLADAGHLDRILLSQDVFLKMMLTRYGGNGYAFVHAPLPAAPERHGMDAASLHTLMTDNPRRVFDATA